MANLILESLDKVSDICVSIFLIYLLFSFGWLIIKSVNEDISENVKKVINVIIFTMGLILICVGIGLLLLFRFRYML